MSNADEKPKDDESYLVTLIPCAVVLPVTAGVGLGIVIGFLAFAVTALFMRGDPMCDLDYWGCLTSRFGLWWETFKFISFWIIVIGIPSFFVWGLTPIGKKTLLSMADEDTQVAALTTTTDGLSEGKAPITNTALNFADHQMGVSKREKGRGENEQDADFDLSDFLGG